MEIDVHYALKDYGADIEWNVGSLFCHDDAIMDILGFCHRYGIQHPIKWAFGCIPSPLASAMAMPKLHTFGMAKQTIENYLEYGVGCRLALTNPHADEKMIASDRNAQKLMDLLNETSTPEIRNGVTLSSDILARHVRDKYPRLDTILSIVRVAYDVGFGRACDTMEWYVEKLKNPLYDVVEVNNAKIHEEGFMEELPRKDKVELIACINCIRNCPYAKHHYESALGVMQDACAAENPEKCRLMLCEVSKMCIANRKRHLDKASSYTREEIAEMAKLGYRRFQLSARMNDDERFLQDVKHYLFNYNHLRYLENLG